MTQHTCYLILSAAILGSTMAVNPSQAQEAGRLDWAALDRTIGRPGKEQPGGIHKYTFPRNDLQITVAGVALKPALALGSWVAFKPVGRSGGGVMAMGDLVLTEAEVPGVIDRLQVGGIRQTALHNHLQGESPRVMYLHIEGHGSAAALGAVINSALAATKTPPPQPTAEAQAPFPLDTSALAKALQRHGTVTGGVYQVHVPRAQPITAEGTEIPPAMGVATVVNFQPTGSGKAAITGDFVLTADEVNPVVRTLKDQGIAVTALHSHMLTEEPRLFFMHFWANDDALKLARVLRSALGHMKVPRASP
jgi:hypothetical protein